MTRCGRAPSAEFDDAATAPLHGFTDADDYYRARARSRISRIDTPVLCISAMDDPFLPPEVLERVKKEASASVELGDHAAGGHVGFVAGPPWRARFWGEEKVVDWLDRESERCAVARRRMMIAASSERNRVRWLTLCAASWDSRSASPSSACGIVPLRRGNCRAS